MQDQHSSRGTPHDSTTPAVLLADDDRSTRYFLHEALTALGCDVTSCADGPPVLALALEGHFDLLLLDCRMPNGGARSIATQLRHAEHAASGDSPIVATSADVSDALRRTVLDAGCAAMMEKPVSTRALRQMLKALLPASCTPPVLDDAQAVNSSGNEAAMRQLRNLFADELRVLLQDLDALMATPAELSERLHRLRAACGFCGASALADEASRVRYLIEHKHTLTRKLSTRLRACITTTLDALEQRSLAHAQA